MRAEDQEDRLLTTLEAARFLGISPGTLQNMRWRKEGPAFVQVGKQAVRYLLSDLREFVERRRVQAG